MRTPDAERRAPGDVARVAARPLSGDEPPDENTGTDKNGERDDNPCKENPAAEKKGPGDEEQEHHDAGDHETTVAPFAGAARPRRPSSAGTSSSAAR